MTMQRQSTRPRLMIDISPELRYRIKVAAAQKELSVREYVEQILEQVVPRVANVPERRPMTPEAFDRLLQFHEQVKQNHQGQTVEDSTEMIRQMREERTQYLAEL